MTHEYEFQKFAVLSLTCILLEGREDHLGYTNENREDLSHKLFAQQRRHSSVNYVLSYKRQKKEKF